MAVMAQEHEHSKNSWKKKEKNSLHSGYLDIGQIRTLGNAAADKEAKRHSKTINYQDLINWIKTEALKIRKEKWQRSKNEMKNRKKGRME
jgi:hypothetical protein